MAMTEVFMGNSKQYTDEFRAEAMKAGQSSGMVIFCTIFKPGFGWRCQAMRYR